MSPTHSFINGTDYVDIELLLRFLKCFCLIYKVTGYLSFPTSSVLLQKAIKIAINLNNEQESYLSKLQINMFVRTHSKAFITFEVEESVFNNGAIT